MELLKSLQLKVMFGSRRDTFWNCNCASLGTFLFSLLSTSMLICAHSTAHLIIYTRNLAHASLETAVRLRVKGIL